MKKYWLVFSLLIAAAYSACGWGAKGHKIVAEIAEGRLEPNVKDSLKKYLGDMSFQDAAVWLDPASHTPEYSYMSTWHYINIPKGEKYTYNDADHNCVTELARSVKALKNRSSLSKDQVALDLKIVAHLCGDITQPLHVGYPNDRGGNDIHMNTGENLHKIWDSTIMYKDSITAQSCLMANAKLTKEELAKIGKEDEAAWLNEAREYLPQVYNFTNNTIDESYYSLNRQTVESQLFKAGIRLADLLNSIFKQ
jgi:S1/P1 Nuclease.